ncbi:MAG: hypothetical protein OEV64_14680 [Desulfobulbaceae bacterium]|nr:hypothetical protein [Desulfobulbaceae bacterium]
MLNSYEIGRLEHYDKKGQTVIGLGVVAVLICWLTAAFNFQQALVYSDGESAQLWIVINDWLQGIDLPAYYTGKFVQATQRLMLGLVDLALGFVFSSFLLFYIREGQLQTKVLRLLKENKILASSGESEK